MYITPSNTYEAPGCQGQKESYYAYQARKSREEASMSIKSLLPIASVAGAPSAMTEFQR